MKYQAVIFDLFGTLVDNYSHPEYQVVLRRMASILSMPVNDYIRLWSATAHKRSIGAISNINANIKYICKELGVPADGTKIGLSAQIRFDFISKTMRPQPDTLETLSCLKSQGFKIALISNCSPETPVIWRDSPFNPLFDVALFSSRIGLKKPDARIYQLAAEQLAVKPENCLYIGDGDSQELSGAAQLGMYPVLIRLAGEDGTQPHLVNREMWDDPVISSLREVLDLVK